MMDYCARESTLCEMPEVGQETSVRDQLDVIVKMLYETSMTLRSIVDNLNGTGRSEDSLVKEDKCMMDTIFTINALSDECLGMSQKVKSILF